MGDIMIEAMIDIGGIVLQDSSLVDEKVKKIQLKTKKRVGMSLKSISIYKRRQ